MQIVHEIQGGKRVLVDPAETGPEIAVPKALAISTETVVADMGPREWGIAEEINAAHRLARHEYARHAIRCGELLLQQKARTRHGEFQKWIDDHCEFAYSTAARYMAAATAKLSGVEISNLSGLFPSGRKAERKNEPKTVSALTAPIAPSSADMTPEQAITLLRGEPNSARSYARLLQRYRADRRAFEKARIALCNSSATLLTAARKIARGATQEGQS